jgi:hypothetical protein
MYVPALFGVVVAALFTYTLAVFRWEVAVLTLLVGGAAGGVFAAAWTVSLTAGVRAACGVSALAVLMLVRAFDGVLAVELAGACAYAAWAAPRPAAHAAALGALVVLAGAGVGGHALLYVVAHAAWHMPAVAAWFATPRWFLPAAMVAGAAAGAAVGGAPAAAAMAAAYMLAAGPQTWRGVGDAAGVALFAAAAARAAAIGLGPRFALLLPALLFFAAGVAREALVGAAPAEMPLVSFYCAWLPRGTARAAWFAAHMALLCTVFIVCATVSPSAIMSGVVAALDRSLEGRG